MKLDRNVNNDGRGKYALLRLRRLNEIQRIYRCRDAYRLAIESAIKTLERTGVLDWGAQGTESEFMVIRLKDKYAGEALEAYANEAGKDDPEYADEIRGMADRAGPHSPWCKKPD